MDVQYALALSYNTPSIYYSTGGLGELVPDLDQVSGSSTCQKTAILTKIQPDPANNQNEPYLDFLHYILALPDEELPKTLTTSYGEDEQSVPAAYANA